MSPALGRTGRRHRRTAAAVALVVVVLGAAACEPTPAPPPPPPPPVMPAGIGAPVADPVPTSHQERYVTRDGSDRYGWSSGPGTMVVTAPSTNTGGNTRGVFADGTTAVTWDHESCASWQGGHGRLIQQGVALRIRDDAGGTRAITVTKNIFFGATYVFNVHLWAPGAVRHIGGRDFRAVVAPEPWHLCARAVGDKVQMKFWTGGDPVPAWGDERHTAVVQLPAGWVYAGRPGGYAGHLEKGDTVRYTNLRTATYPRPRADAEVLVRTLYDEVQRRTPTAANVALWQTRLQDGWTREQAARTFSTDVHGRRATIDDAYRLVLGRPADPSGRSYWTAQLDGGRTYASFVGALGGAAAFPAGRAGDEAYAAHIWQAVLGRPITPAQQRAWADHLAGGWTRSRLAEYLWSVPESRLRQASLAFTAVTGRPPTAAERDHWALRFVQLDRDPVRLIAAVVIATVALPVADDDQPEPPVVVEPEPPTEPPATTAPPPETTTTTAPPGTTDPDPEPAPPTSSSTSTSEVAPTPTSEPEPPPPAAVIAARPPG